MDEEYAEWQACVLCEKALETEQQVDAADAAAVVAIATEMRCRLRAL